MLKHENLKKMWCKLTLQSLEYIRQIHRQIHQIYHLGYLGPDFQPQTHRNCHLPIRLPLQ